MNQEKRSITRTESQGRGRGITIKVVSLKPRPLDTQLIVKIIHMSDKYEVKSLTLYLNIAEDEGSGGLFDPRF